MHSRAETIRLDRAPALPAPATAPSAVPAGDPPVARRPGHATAPVVAHTATVPAALPEAKGLTFAKLQRHLLPWLIPALAGLLWVLATHLGWVSKHVLPKPEAVWAAVVDLFLKDDFAHDLGISTRRALSGFFVGSGIGLALGLIAGLSRMGDLLIDTTMQMKRTVPTLAILPLIIIWFGIGETMRTVLIALGALFPVYVNTYYGMRSADPALLEVGRVYGLGAFAQFRRIILPSALPSILLGIRFALGGMWLALIAAEMIGTTSGIGFVTNVAREFMQTDVVLFILFLYALLGKGTDMFVRWIERVTLPWHHSYNGNLNR